MADNKSKTGSLMGTKGLPAGMLREQLIASDLLNSTKTTIHDYIKDKTLKKKLDFIDRINLILVLINKNTRNALKRAKSQDSIEKLEKEISDRLTLIQKQKKIREELALGLVGGTSRRLTKTMTPKTRNSAKGYKKTHKSKTQKSKTQKKHNLRKNKKTKSLPKK
jgi:hypothetical protein